MARLRIAIVRRMYDRCPCMPPIFDNKGDFLQMHCTSTLMKYVAPDPSNNGDENT